MVTKKDLQVEVDRLNNKYCKNTKNHFVINEKDSGFMVGMTGKDVKIGKKIYKVKGSLSNRFGSIGNTYHTTASKTLEGVRNAEKRGWLEYSIQLYENLNINWDDTK